jgi:hypothetical protein
MPDLVVVPASPSVRPSPLRSFYERALSPIAIVNTHVTPYASSAINLVRSEGEAALAGLLMAWLEDKNGSLDVKGKYPIDGIGSAVFGLLSLWLSKNPDGLSVDARNLSTALTGIYFYRNYSKMKRVVAQGSTEPAVSSEIASDDDRLVNIMSELMGEAA